jgi:hydrogenase maturation protein HypF
VIGVAFDGSGHGDDGTVWGGEFLVGDARAVERMGHVRTVPLPGLEQAVREPWRMALSHLWDAGETYADWIGSEQRVAAHVLTRMMDRGLNSPLTSSVGRLFDAVAALAGRRRVVSFEGQAAMELEGLAAASSDQGQYPYALARADGRLVIDTRPMIRAVAHDARSGQDATVIARRFHEGLATATADVCTQLSATTGIREVVLTGGVFLNAVLTAACTSRLEHAGLRVYRHRLVPPNDGGLSLGQVAVAAARLSAEHASLDAV